MPCGHRVASHVWKHVYILMAAAVHLSNSRNVPRCLHSVVRFDAPGISRHHTASNLGGLGVTQPALSQPLHQCPAWTTVLYTSFAYWPNRLAQHTGSICSTLVHCMIPWTQTLTSQPQSLDHLTSNVGAQPLYRPATPSSAKVLRRMDQMPRCGSGAALPAAPAALAAATSCCFAGASVAQARRVRTRSSG
jgi:hypothetical protein